MKGMKSLMKSLQKPNTSTKDTNSKQKTKNSTVKEPKKKTSKEKKNHGSAPAPSIMGAPGTVATTTQADLMGMSTKKGGGGGSRRRTRAKASLPVQPSRTVMMPVEPTPKPRPSDSEFELANSVLSPMSSAPGTPVTTSPASTPGAVSPHPAHTPSSGSAESPHQSVWEQKEVDLPMETADQIVDPEKETRPINGRDPECMSPEQMCNLKAFITQFEQLGVRGLMEEFATVKGYNLQPFDITAHEGNPMKNRYQDIFCIEPTRVRLMDGKEGEYIHANYVKGPPFMNQFVTTQGPLEPTVNDFWRLTVQENVGYIFMLCSIVELGKKKCEQYIPETEGETRFYGDIKVTLEKKQEDSHFINSKLLVEPPGKQRRYIYHHFWKNWPDRGVPITALAGLRLLRHARMTTYSTIVHCSAGVGRTGTLVAIEWLLQRILTASPPYDMREMLRAVRNQRAHAIQTAPQYAYVCFAVFRLFTLLEPSNTAAFHKFSADMQTYAGVVLPPPPGAAGGGAPADPNPAGLPV